MNPDGTGQTNCTNNPAYDFNPAWSPDSTKLAFSSTRDGNQEIYVINADCTGPVRLTNNPADDLSPKWSPDGTKIDTGGEFVAEPAGRFLDDGSATIATCATQPS